MQCAVKIPCNGKLVTVEVPTFKMLRDLYASRLDMDTTMEKLEKLIITPGLNVIEKFITLLLVRDEYVSSDISIQGSDKVYNVDVSHIIDAFDEIAERPRYWYSHHTNYPEDSINAEGILCGVPTSFNNKSLPCIIAVAVKNGPTTQKYTKSDELHKFLSNMPASLYSVYGTWVTKNRNFLEFDIIKHDTVGELTISFADDSYKLFLQQAFCFIDDSTYREYVYALTRSLKSPEFIVNSTFIDIADYCRMYEEESKTQQEA